MEAVLASAAYLEQGIAWGEFCLSNLYLKHALCVETKNCLSAEAVSYKMVFSIEFHFGGPSLPASFPAAGWLLPSLSSLPALGQSDSLHY